MNVLFHKYEVCFRIPFMFLLVINFLVMTRVILYDFIIYDFKNNFLRANYHFLSEHIIINSITLIHYIYIYIYISYFE